MLSSSAWKSCFIVLAAAVLWLYIKIVSNFLPTIGLLAIVALIDLFFQLDKIYFSNRNFVSSHL